MLHQIKKSNFYQYIYFGSEIKNKTTQLRDEA